MLRRFLIGAVSAYSLGPPDCRCRQSMPVRVFSRSDPRGGSCYSAPNICSSLPSAAGKRKQAPASGGSRSLVMSRSASLGGIKVAPCNFDFRSPPLASRSPRSTKARRSLVAAPPVRTHFPHFLRNYSARRFGLSIRSINGRISSGVPSTVPVNERVLTFLSNCSATELMPERFRFCGCSSRRPRSIACWPGNTGLVAARSIVRP